MDYIISIIDKAPPLFLLLSALILIDAFTAFRYYYLDKLYNASEKALNKQLLEYKKSVVIHGYKTLVSEEFIEKALADYRALEEKLGRPMYDFTELKEEYKKKLRDASNRGYI